MNCNGQPARHDTQFPQARYGEPQAARPQASCGSVFFQGEDDPKMVSDTIFGDQQAIRSGPAALELRSSRLQRAGAPVRK